MTMHGESVNLIACRRLLPLPLPAAPQKQLSLRLKRFPIRFLMFAKGQRGESNGGLSRNPLTFRECQTKSARVAANSNRQSGTLPWFFAAPLVVMTRWNARRERGLNDWPRHLFAHSWELPYMTSAQIRRSGVVGSRSTYSKCGGGLNRGYILRLEGWRWGQTQI